MNNLATRWGVFISLLFITSCSNPMTKELESPTVQALKNGSCPIIESDKWHAWIDRYQKTEDSYRLNVSGEVNLPTPAYEINWSIGPTDRMAPPGIRLFLEPVSQEGMAIQLITTKKVEYNISTSIKHYRHVSIYCEGVLLVQINDVMLTD